MQSKKKKIEPELLETPWQKRTTAKMEEWLGQPYEAYPAGEMDVGRILESPYYQALKTGALREETAGIGRLRRGAQLGGMLYSTPRLGAEAELIGGTTTRLQQILGGMGEAERVRGQEREYAEHLRKQKYPLEMSQLAQILLGYSPWYQPMYEEQRGGWGGALGGILGALATGATGGLSPLLGALLGREAGGAILP